MHVPVYPLSLSLSLSLHLQKRFGSRSDPKGIQERMFRQFKNFAHALENKQWRTNADAHDRMGFQYISISVYIGRSHARIQREVSWSEPPFPPPPLKDHKNIEFLSKTRPDPLKFSKFAKLRSQRSTLGHHRHASETPFSLAGR